MSCSAPIRRTQTEVDQLVFSLSLLLSLEKDLPDTSSASRSSLSFSCSLRSFNTRFIQVLLFLPLRDVCVQLNVFRQRSLKYLVSNLDSDPLALIKMSFIPLPLNMSVFSATHFALDSLLYLLTLCELASHGTFVFTCHLSLGCWSYS